MGWVAHDMQPCLLCHLSSRAEACHGGSSRYRVPLPSEPPCALIELPASPGRRAVLSHGGIVTVPQDRAPCVAGGPCEFPETVLGRLRTSERDSAEGLRGQLSGHDAVVSRSACGCLGLKAEQGGGEGCRGDDRGARADVVHLGFGLSELEPQAPTSRTADSQHAPRGPGPRHHSAEEPLIRHDRAHCSASVPP